MKIWIDICNAPHVNFFKQFIEEWKQEHDVIVTARPLSNTIDLLEKNKIQYHSVGAHYGKKSISKLLGFFKRSNELCSFLKNQNVSLAISQSSFYSPYVARKLKIPSIYTNDNEFAKGNYVGFILANQILLPEALEKWVNNRFFRGRVTYYPGVKEGIYIKKPEKHQIKNGFQLVYFRPEPWHSQYHKFNTDLFDDMLENLSKNYSIIILPRDEEQRSHFCKLSEKHHNILIPGNVETIDTIARKCDVFLGAGGSMTREFSLMGIPTISMYQGQSLEVDKYLIDNNLLISQTDPKKITPEFITSLIENKSSLNESHERIEKKGLEARILMHQLITNHSKLLT